MRDELRAIQYFLRSLDQNRDKQILLAMSAVADSTHVRLEVVASKSVKYLK